ncbi:MAG: ABC transporter ATP-binding protein [Pseudomonadota bacterium]
MTEPVLRVEGLSKRFGAVVATDDVTLDLRPGEIHALIGPNGAGKSTLIGQIAGGIRPDRGRVMLGGEDLTALSVAARARRGLGRSFQISSLAPPLSALANVRIGAQAGAGSTFRFWQPVARDQDLRAVAEAALTRVDLTARSGVPVAELSHGERRQVEVACALALTPKALLLDEPMAGLGAEGTRRLTALLADLKSEVPILLIEHDMEAVFALADRISVLASGRVIASGSGAEIRADPAVRVAYLGDEADA